MVEKVERSLLHPSSQSSQRDHPSNEPGPRLEHQFLLELGHPIYIKKEVDRVLQRGRESKTPVSSTYKADALLLERFVVVIDIVAVVVVVVVVI